MRDPIFGNGWDALLAEEREQAYYQKLQQFLIEEYQSRTIYPDRTQIFSALQTVDPGDVRVVILGQDPYHEEGQAHGMAFSVLPGVKQPPSLGNIFKELQDDLGYPRPPANCGYLMPWAQQGVLLLNTVLTVRQHQAGSHRGKGWEAFTDAVIQVLAKREKPLVFLLWGANAKNKVPLIKAADPAGRHLILTGAHPSPLSAYNGFFGGHYFSKTNDFLVAQGARPVDWHITP